MNIFRRVLNKDNTDGNENFEGKTVVMTGPLSDVYTNALNVALDKADNKEQLAIESQANDALMAANMVEGSKPNTVVYGVDISNINKDNVSDVVSIVANEHPYADEFIMAIDCTNMQDGVTYKHVGSMESLSQKYNFKIVRSLEELKNILF